MYSEADLEAAVAAGALSRTDAERLRDFVAATRASPAVDEEHFRLVTGFNDFFVSIAAIILLIAVGWIGNSLPPHLDNDGPSPFAGLFVATAAWGLAEFFTARRRMALPSILLLLAFVLGTFVAAGAVFAHLVGAATMRDSNMATALLLSASAAVAAISAWFHWRRFRVPITVAAGAGACVAVALGILAYLVGKNDAMRDVMLSACLVSGLAVFAFAMRWDASDPRRETRRADVAFWLHLLAAPLIVHPIFALLGLTDGSATAVQAVIVLIVYLALGVAALAVDRRALLVSALAYVLWSLTDLFERFGAVEMSFAFTALIIGSALLLLSAFWHNVRAAVVRLFPASLQAQLPVVDRVSLRPAS